MLSLSKVPYAKVRLNLWNFMYDFDENKESIIVAIKNMHLVNI